MIVITDAVLLDCMVASTSLIEILTVTIKLLKGCHT